MNSYYDVDTKRSNVAMLLEKYGPNRVRFFEGDLCDAPFITTIFETEGVEWVVHMAARAGVRPSIEDPFVYVHSNVEATTRLLELSRVHGVKSFVFASSSSVYGGSQKEVSQGRERITCSGDGGRPDASNGRVEGIVTVSVPPSLFRRVAMGVPGPFTAAAEVKRTLRV